MVHAALNPWPAPPDRIAPEPGWVHIFRLALDLPEERLASLRAYLPPDEQARADRFVRERDRKRFTAAHGQMREILSRYTGFLPAALRFSSNPQGKPALTNGPCFNLSHSAGLGLLGILPGQAVGVDIEAFRPDIDYENIARRFFSASEADTLMALKDDQRPQGFYNCWTRKEAYIKARGQGLSIPLDSFSVSLAPGDPPQLSAPDAGWSLHVVEPGTGFAGALVVEGEIKGIRCWAWETL